MALRDEQPLLVAPNWMESDTEESIVGTEWHQEAIGALALMLEDVAARRAAEKRLRQEQAARQAEQAARRALEEEIQRLRALYEERDQ